MSVEAFDLNGKKTKEFANASDFESELKKAGWLFVVGKLKEKTVCYSGSTQSFYLVDDFAYKIAKNYEMSKISIPDVPTDFEWYTHFGIALTSRCNLACKYCFGFGGRRKAKTIEWEKIKAAIDYISKVNGDHPVKMGFISAGEIGLAFDLLKKTVEYAKEKLNVEVVGTSTNGVISKEVCEWMVKNMQTIQVSLDGPPEIQNYQRPLANGGPSSKYVERTIEHLKRIGANFNVRASFTKLFINNLEYCMNYFEMLGVNRVSIFPLKPIGAAKNWDMLPTVEEIKAATLKIIELNKEHYNFSLGLGVNLEGPDFNTGFCALGRNFCLGLDGKVSACLMYTDKYDEKAMPGIEEFVFGYYDKNAKKFFIDEKKRAEHKEFPNKVMCKLCSFKLCRGLCPYVNLHENGCMLIPSTYMCRVTSERYYDMLKYYFNRFFTKKYPYIMERGKKLSLIMQHNEFELQEGLDGKTISNGVYLKIRLPEDRKKMMSIAKKAFDIKKKNFKLALLFLISFDFEKSASEEDLKAIEDFLRYLSKKKIFFRVAKPINFYFSERNKAKVKKLEEEFSIPKTCEACMELFRVTEDNRIKFCNGQFGPDINSFETREDIFRLAKKLNFCNSCRNF